MKRIFTILGLTAYVVCLNACAYQETMDARNREGALLQNEYNREVERGKQLKR